MLHPPVIIIGAGRSGTKMLRSIIQAHPDTVIFPREINYIWRHGNRDLPTDELQPRHATPAVKKYIHGQFDKRGNTHSSAETRVVEKTCANTLRVGFVNEIFPEAQFIHIIRDGRAVAASARRRWTAPPEPLYLLEKARWVPIQDVPYYAFRYLSYQLTRLFTKENRAASWGPRFEGVDEAVESHSLIEVCGIQWQESVGAAQAALSQGIGTSRYIQVYYEQLVTQPQITTEYIYDFLNLNLAEKQRAFIRSFVKTNSLNKWRDQLSEADKRLLLDHIAPMLLQHGYLESEPVT